MPASDLVVADTSPLLNLALIDRLSLLTEQFGRLTTTQIVWEEIAAGEDGLTELRELRDQEFLDVVQFQKNELYVELRRDLDEGEASVIAYAIQNDADLVLLDEREGRKAARRHDLEVTGVLGVLLRAAASGDIDIEYELERLRGEGFWIHDDLYDEVVRRGTE